VTAADSQVKFEALLRQCMSHLLR